MSLVLPNEPNNAVPLLKKILVDNIYNALKELLGSKHLYQSVDVDIEFYEKAKEQTNPIFKGIVEKRFAIDCLWNEWQPQHSPFDLSKQLAEMTSKKERFIINIPDVKLYCKTCRRIEAYNFISGLDFYSVEATRSASPEKYYQGFVFSFLCQSCKSFPEIFIVRRDELKLTLCGRSPIEAIQVPKSIPKQIKKYYSDGVVASQSGQVLSGLFMLRTLIEQWSRKCTNVDHKEADKLIDAYMEKLPDDFKQRFPSFRKLYGKLSEDLHLAVGSAQLFKESILEIQEHFEAIKLFKIKFN